MAFREESSAKQVKKYFKIKISLFKTNGFSK
jgi:hypothetical protein